MDEDRTVLPELLSARQVAAAFGVTGRTLLYWDKRGHGPRRIRVGPRTGLYIAAEVRAFLMEQAARPDTK